LSTLCRCSACCIRLSLQCCHVPAGGRKEGDEGPIGLHKPVHLPVQRVRSGLGAGSCIYSPQLRHHQALLLLLVNKPLLGCIPHRRHGR